MLRPNTAGKRNVRGGRDNRDLPNAAPVGSDPEEAVRCDDARLLLKRNVEDRHNRQFVVRVEYSPRRAAVERPINSNICADIDRRRRIRSGGALFVYRDRVDRYIGQARAHRRPGGGSAREIGRLPHMGYRSRCCAKPAICDVCRDCRSIGRVRVDHYLTDRYCRCTYRRDVC